MPGGTGGSRTIQGVGFWAQQPYYNIFSVDSGPFIFRPLQRSLPEAWWVPPANAFQSWTYQYNPNLIGQDRLPVGGIITDTPQQLPRVDTWFQQYNASLYSPAVTVSLYVRPPIYGLAGQLAPLAQQSAFPNFNVLQPTVVTYIIRQSDWPLPIAPQQPAPSWAWSYNLNLIGQDKLPTGEQRTELTSAQVPPDQIQLRSWQWWYNLSLLGKDRMLVGKQVWELAPSQRAPEQVQLHSWTWSYNLNLVGKDQLPTGEQISDLAPAQKPYRIDPTWTWSYNLNLVGQDRMVTGAQVTDLPPRDFARLFQTWISSVNAALVTAPANLYAQARQQDWPLPRGAEPDWRRSWEFSYNKNLVGQDQLPFRQQDWPNPILPATLRDWIQQTNLALLAQPPTLLPYKRTLYELPLAGPQQAASWTWQYNLNLIGQDAMIKSAQVTDLPPIYPPYINQLRTWAWWYNFDLIGQDQLPFRQMDWPLTPAAQRAVDLGTWIDRTKFLLNQLYKPFAQYDWPNPTTPFRDPTLATLARGYNLDLLGQDRLPNRQQDWPLSPAYAPTLLQTWIAPTNLPLVPVAQLPPGIMNFGVITNRPQLRADVPADLYTITHAQQIPQPTPTVTPAVYNKPMLAGPGYLDVIPGEKPS
jgi:hypothetical protein